MPALTTFANSVDPSQNGSVIEENRLVLILNAKRLTLILNLLQIRCFVSVFQMISNKIETT